MLFGDHGWFAFTPIMGWAIFALAKCLGQREHPLWSEALTVSSGSLVTVLYFALFTNNFGGTSYGPRWVIAMTPLLFFFIQFTQQLPSLVRRGSPDRRATEAENTAAGNNAWQYFVFAGLALLSLASAWRGALDPWTHALPLLRLEDATSVIARYIRSDPTVSGAVSGAVIYITPPETVKHPLTPWSDRDLTGLPKRAREFDASSGLLPTGDPDRPLLYVVRDTHNDATITRLETAFPQGTWGLLIDGKGIYHIPPGENRAIDALTALGSTSSHLQIFEESKQTFEFDKKIRLIAYALSHDTTQNLQPGATLRIHLAWQVVVPPEQSYTAFVHLVRASTLWAQDDHQPGYTTRPTYPTDRWFPGEIVLDEFQLTIPPEVPTGTYQLNTGFYTLTTLQRLPRSDAQGDTATLTTISIEK
jgi:hypothetical protein